MMKFELFPPQFDQIVDLLQGSNAYLAGGAVRDLLLERPVHDLDFALPKGTIPAAKKVADQMDGGFFVKMSLRFMTLSNCKTNDDIQKTVTFSSAQTSFS